MPYIGKSPSFGVRSRFVYLASSGDTSVSGADANGATLTFTDGAYVDVYLNGVLLKPTTDYNTSTANTIAGLSALNTNDEVTVVVYDIFTVADMVSATSGGTFSGAVTANSTLDMNGTELILDADGDTSITADTDDRIDFKTGGTDRLQIQNTSGNNVVIADGLTLTDGNLIVASGHGIDFSATGDLGSSINETLTDYEKGTFTATMSGTSGSAGSVAGNTGTFTYIKIGNFIHINGSIAISNLGSYSGNIQITGLPVTAGANHGYGLGIGLHNLDSRSDASANFKARVGAGSTTILISKPDTTSVAWSELGTGYIGIGGGYQDFG